MTSQGSFSGMQSVGLEKIEAEIIKTKNRIRQMEQVDCQAQQTMKWVNDARNNASGYLDLLIKQHQQIKREEFFTICGEFFEITSQGWGNISQLMDWQEQFVQGEIAACDLIQLLRGRIKEVGKQNAAACQAPNCYFCKQD